MRLLPSSTVYCSGANLSPAQQVFWGLAITFWGTLIGVPGISLLATLKFLPGTVRAVYEYCRLLKELQIWFWLFWLCGLALLIACCPVLYALVVFCSAGVGPACAAKALQKDSLKLGFLEVCH